MKIETVQDLFIKHCGTLQVSLADLPAFNSFCKELSSITDHELREEWNKTNQANYRLSDYERLFSILGLAFNFYDEEWDFGYGESVSQERLGLTCRERSIIVDNPGEEFDRSTLMEFRDLLNNEV